MSDLTIGARCYAAQKCFERTRGICSPRRQAAWRRLHRDAAGGTTILGSQADRARKAYSAAIAMARVLTGETARRFS